MSNFSIRQRIIATFAVMFAVMIGAAAFAYTELVGAENEATSVQTDSLPGLYDSDQILVRLVANFALTQSAIAEEGPAGADGDRRVVADRTELEALVRKSEPLIAQGRDTENFADFKDLLASYFNIQDDVVKAGSDPSRARALAADQLQPVFEKARTVIRNIADANNVDTKHSADQIKISIASAKLERHDDRLLRWPLLLLYAISGLGSSAGDRQDPLQALRCHHMAEVRPGDFTKRVKHERRDEFGVLADSFNRMVDDVAKLVGEVQMSGLQVSSSANEIAATSKEQQATASEIFTTTMEIGATSKEISASTKELVKTMGDVSSVAEQAAALASERS